MVNVNNLRSRVMPLSASGTREQADKAKSATTDFWTSVRGTLQKCCPQGLGVPVMQRSCTSNHLTAISMLVGPTDEYVKTNRPPLMVLAEPPPPPLYPQKHF